jgi:hypothetical protein
MPPNSDTPSNEDENIVAICKICKGPLQKDDPVMFWENGMRHLSQSRCEWMKKHIEESDLAWLKSMEICYDE